ncbi:hypothetical protein [Bradyrhizobium sp. Leo121]|uniref:hypothetical protein n=1 Tax=Bradyrhizobium sp. Leo121 TaxID=1571195 RepID=UPI00102A6E7A|nr:hypothetical protein [Bradyrhizobium sp. Leo121]RZN24767.1 hypothetical protein CWO90_28410 [Bradyrhizobium sp. Leo121]
MADFVDDKYYRVELLRAVDFGGTIFRPEMSGTVMRGGVINLLMQDPKNEGAFGATTEVKDYGAEAAQ